MYVCMLCSVCVYTHDSWGDVHMTTPDIFRKTFSDTIQAFPRSYIPILSHT